MVGPLVVPGLAESVRQRDDHAHHVVGHHVGVGAGRVRQHDVALDKLGDLHQAVDPHSGAVDPPQAVRFQEGVAGYPAVEDVGVPDLFELLVDGVNEREVDVRKAGLQLLEERRGVRARLPGQALS